MLLGRASMVGLALGLSVTLASGVAAQDGRNGLHAAAVWTNFRQTATDASADLKGFDFHYSRSGGGQGWGEIGATVWEPGRYLIYLGGGRFFGESDHSVYIFGRAGFESGSLPNNLVADRYRPDMAAAGVVLGGAGVQFHLGGPVSLDVGGAVGLDLWYQGGQVGEKDARLMRKEIYVGLKLNFGRP